jgi:deoxyinosine 3'endonuclease (endonuclease V)
MKAALDVHYAKGKAFAACIVFNTWLDSEPAETYRIPTLLLLADQRARSI